LKYITPTETRNIFLGQFLISFAYAKYKKKCTRLYEITKNKESLCTIKKLIENNIEYILENISICLPINQAKLTECFETLTQFPKLFCILAVLLLM